MNEQGSCTNHLHVTRLTFLFFIQTKDKAQSETANPKRQPESKGVGCSNEASVVVLRQGEAERKEASSLA